VKNISIIFWKQNANKPFYKQRKKMGGQAQWQAKQGFSDPSVDFDSQFSFFTPSRIRLV
jgi:hypothetical protein